jgi:hypothetical protein
MPKQGDPCIRSEECFPRFCCNQGSCQHPGFLDRCDATSAFDPCPMGNVCSRYSGRCVEPIYVDMAGNAPASACRPSEYAVKNSTTGSVRCLQRLGEGARCDPAERSCQAGLGCAPDAIQGSSVCLRACLVNEPSGHGCPGELVCVDPSGARPTASVPFIVGACYSPSNGHPSSSSSGSSMNRGSRTVFIVAGGSFFAIVFIACLIFFVARSRNRARTMTTVYQTPPPPPTATYAYQQPATVYMQSPSPPSTTTFIYR